MEGQTVPFSSAERQNLLICAWNIHRYKKHIGIRSISFSIIVCLLYHLSLTVTDYNIIYYWQPKGTVGSILSITPPLLSCILRIKTEPMIYAPQVVENEPFKV